MPQVVDYSFSHPDPAAIARAGFVGAVRYLWTPPKGVTADELAHLDTFHLSCAFVFESTANRAGQGQPAGVVDAAQANQLADALGIPVETPIYFAVDFQATVLAVSPYFDGLVSRSRRPVGIYAHYDLVEFFCGTGRIQYGWQCAAWSGTGTGSGGSIQGRRVSKYACLFQEVGYVLGDTADVNDVLKPDWGQYPRTTPPPVTPTHLPTEDPVPSALVFDKSVPAPLPVYHVMGLERKHVASEDDCTWLVSLGATDMRTAPDDTQARLIRNSTNVDILATANAGTDLSQILTAINALPAATVAAIKAAL